MSTTTIPPPLPRVKPPPGARMPFNPAAACAALLAESDRRGLTRAELARRAGIHQSQLGRLGVKTTAVTFAGLLSALALPWRWLDTVASPDPAPAPPPRVCPRCGSPVTGGPRAAYCRRPECKPAKSPAASRVESAAKKSQVLAMHAAGRPARDIVAATGFTPSYVYTIIRKGAAP